MESANLRQRHQLQQLLGLCSSLAAESGFGVSTINDWNQSIILNRNAYSTYMSEILPNSTRELGQKDVNLIPSVKTSRVQSIDFHEPRSFSHQSDDVLRLGKIKEDISDHCLPKYGGVTYNTPSTKVENSQFPSTSYVNHDQPYVLDIRGGGCMIQPFSSGGQTSPGVPGIQTRQLYSSNTESCAMFAETVSLEHVHVEESNDDPLNNFKEVGWTSSFKNEVTRAKRSGGFSAPKVSREAAKKSRLMSQSSYLPPLKVRKEKLGDRIAALHGLVSPFGKTDTASVLTEAIGYIQFLQDQIQTLTVPYMKSSFNSHNPTIQMISKMEDGNEELKRDLRSRGLCLMPLSLTSYIPACSRSSI